MPTTSEPLSWPRSHRDPLDPINPAPELARIRSEQPVFGVRRPLPMGGSLTMWLITKYADARELLSSRDTSNSLGRSESAAAQPGFLTSLDPPDHTRIRHMLTGQFSMRRLSAMRPYIEEITTKFLDQMEAAGPPVDLMQAFALPLPSLVICRCLVSGCGACPSSRSCLKLRCSCWGFSSIGGRHVLCQRKAAV